MGRRMLAKSGRDRMNDLIEEEWQAWYRLTPEQRWDESMKLWEFYRAMGGSLDPEPDSQSP
jgi:hypothetical protein